MIYLKITDWDGFVMTSMPLVRNVSNVVTKQAGTKVETVSHCQESTLQLWKNFQRMPLALEMPKRIIFSCF